jgi:ABC-type iron transport system FetAB ATPase subunit
MDTRIFGGGAFQLTFDPSVNLLHENFNTLTATATNGEGSYTETGTLHIVPPATPAAPSDASVVNGYVNAAHDTADQMLTGTAEKGSTVTVYDDNVQVGSTTADATSGYWSLPIGTLVDDSTHSYTVTATAAGNVSQQSSALKFVVDTDTDEQGSLKLTVQTTSISAAMAALVPFTIAGLESEDTGTVTFTDVNQKSVAVDVTGGQTSYTANLSSLADGTITSSLSVNTDSAGNSFTPVGGSSVSLDQDSSEQAALKLTVNDNSATPIGAAGAATVAFTVAGLDFEDSGVVTFSDGTNKVTVNVNGSQADYTANLTPLAEGTITSSLSVNADAAGNTLLPVGGNSVSLDQDSAEQGALKLTVGTKSISAATATAVPFAIAGLDPEDTGTVTFTDINGKSFQVNVTGGQTSYMANLSSLADGTIKSTLAVNTDLAGNHFVPVAGTTVTLTQHDHWINTSGGNWTNFSSWATWSGAHTVPTGAIDADFDTRGTYRSK